MARGFPKDQAQYGGEDPAPPPPPQEDAVSPAAWHGFHSSEGLSGISPMKSGTADVPMTMCRISADASHGQPML